MGKGSSDPERLPPTASEQALAETGAQRYMRFQKLFGGLAHQAAGMVLGMGDDETFGNIAGASVASAYGKKAPEIINSQATAAGLGSGRMLQSTAGFASDEAGALGLGRYNADMASQARYANALQSMMDIGNGQASNSITSLGQLGSTATRRAIADAKAAQAARAATGQAIGGVVGALGAGYINNMGSATKAAGDFSFDTAKGVGGAMQGGTDYTFGLTLP